MMDERASTEIVEAKGAIGRMAAWLGALIGAKQPADPGSSLPPGPIFRPAPEPPGYDFPEYSEKEKLLDAIVHLLSVFLSIAGVSAMITLAAIYNDAATIASIAIYGAGLIIVFATSAAYHLVRSPRLKSRLRRMDHAAIFIKIAGTYTPFAVVSIGGVWGVVLLTAVWTIAAVGVPMKLFAPDRIEKIAVMLYLLQGWMLLVAIGPIEIANETLALILIGGASYTVGVFFHLSPRLPFHNAIWHMFVLTGSGFMYAAILSGVAFA